MGISSAAREMRRRSIAQKQIDMNLDSKPERIVVCDKAALQTIIYPMDAYSTKFMSPEDQFVLAVDRVDAPEVKVALTPEILGTEQYIDALDEGVFDYASHLSLNFGDPGALKTIEMKMADVPVRCYMFRDGQEGEEYNIPDEALELQNDGSFDYVDGFVPIHPPENDKDWQGQDISYEDLPNIKFVLLQKRDADDDNRIEYAFDLYDGGSISGNVGVPAITASMVLTKERGRYTEEKINWEYVVSMHVDENKKPKDAVTKNTYLMLQRFMRAIIVTMGITPSKL